MGYSPFCVWLSSLHMMSSRVIRVVACDTISPLFKAQQYFTVCPHLIDGRSGCFFLLAVSIMLLWTRVCKYLFETLLSIMLGIYLERELLDRMVDLFTSWAHPVSWLEIYFRITSKFVSSAQTSLLNSWPVFLTVYSRLNLDTQWASRTWYLPTLNL